MRNALSSIHFMRKQTTNKFMHLTVSNTIYMNEPLLQLSLCLIPSDGYSQQWLLVNFPIIKCIDDIDTSLAQFLPPTHSLPLSLTSHLSLYTQVKEREYWSTKSNLSSFLFLFLLDSPYNQNTCTENRPTCFPPSFCWTTIADQIMMLNQHTHCQRQ